MEDIKSMTKKELLDYLESISKQLDNIALDQIPIAIAELQFFKEENKKFYEGEIFTAKQAKNIEQHQKEYFINKQVIKKKIKKIKSSLKDDCIALHEFQRLAKIDVLEELLGDDE